MMTSKKRLVISDTAPLYPPLWGGPKRIWGLFGGFPADQYEITYVGSWYGGNGHLRYAYQRIRDGFEEYLCRVPAHHTVWRAFERRFLADWPVDLFVYLWMRTDRQFCSLLNGVDRDLTVCSHPWAFPCLERRHQSRLVYDAHNCEFLLMEQVLKGYPFKKPVLRAVKEIEGELCRASRLVLVCSQKEKNDFIDVYGIDPAKIVLVPNGTDLRPLVTDQERMNAKTRAGLEVSRKVVLFIGSYYRPNITAVRALIDRIAPRAADCLFAVAGSVGQAFTGQRLPENVKCFGAVSEDMLSTLLDAADVAVNPVSEGAGVNIKMLDYMAAGLPVVTTACGARGLDDEAGVPVRICAVEESAQHIAALLADRGLWLDMSVRSRALIERRYSWAMISSSLREVVRELF